MMINPREYQIEAIDAVLAARDREVTRQLVVLPTGSGKTVVFGLLAKHLNCRTLIIAHREQLIKQAVDKVNLVWPEVQIGVCMAERNECDAQVVVASIQSASRSSRLPQLKEQNFSFLIIDEAHHASSESYTRLIQELRFNDDPSKLLVGFTATPYRQVGGLGDVFQEIVFERSIATMIRAGYLSDLKGKRILTSCNLDNVATSRGDFVENELAEVCNSPERNKLIVESFLEHAPKRKGIAFCCDVKHSIDLAQSFKSAGINATAIYGDMPDGPKNDILKKFSSGDLQVLTNCSLLTEGFDEPSVDTVLMCRPTRSKALYVQCVGRGTRLFPGKENCLVMDFCDSFHDVSSIATLEKTVSEVSDESNEDEDTQDTTDKKKSVSTVFVGSQFVGDFDLIDRSRFAWIQIKEHWLLTLSPETSLWLRKGESGYLPSLQHKAVTSALVGREIPLEYAMGISEDWVRRNPDFENFVSKDSTWRNEAPSPRQIEILRGYGYQVEGMNKGDATQIISQKINEKNLWKFEPASAKQRYFLQQNKVKFGANLTKGDASLLINKIKENREVTK